MTQPSSREVFAYIPKGPSRTFRHFCSAFQLVSDKIDEFMTEGQPGGVAEFHRKLNADAAILAWCADRRLHCTYETKSGDKVSGHAGGLVWRDS